MTHLPECDPIPPVRSCICDRLRACEQRLVDAAREAVVPQNVRSAYLVSLSPQEQRIAVSALELAARAIDALREEQK